MKIEVANNHSDAFDKWSDYAKEIHNNKGLNLSSQYPLWTLEYCKTETEHQLLIKNHGNATAIVFTGTPEILNDCYAFFSSLSFKRIQKEAPDNNAISVVVGLPTKTEI